MPRAVIHTLFVGTLVVIIAAAIYFTAAPAFELSFAMYLLVNFIFCIDFIDLLVRLYMRNLAGSRAGDEGEAPILVPLDEQSNKTPLRPWAVIVSVHNAESSLNEFLVHMQPFRDRLWVIDDASVDDTFPHLVREGIRTVRGHINRKKPGALRYLLRSLPSEIETVIVLDPDCIVLSAEGRERQELEAVVRDFQASGAAAMTPRVVLRPDGMLARMQEVEYALALSLGRRSLGGNSITSGVAVYRRDALLKALDRHSLSVYAEDLQNALILLGDGESIYYDDRMTVQTEGKRSFRSWFSQRVGWLFGLIKVYTENYEDGRKAADRSWAFSYQFFVYTGAFCILFHPIRLILLAQVGGSLLNLVDNFLASRFGTINLIPDVAFTQPTYFLMAYITYTVLTLVGMLLSVRLREIPRLLPAIVLFFPYCLLHIVPVTIGYLNFITMMLFGRRVYRDHYQDEASLRHEVASRA